MTAEATVDECIELAQALEQQRALMIVAAVKALAIGGDGAILLTPFQAGFQMACEEIEHRLRTEQWELCGVPDQAIAAVPTAPDFKEAN